MEHNKSVWKDEGINRLKVFGTITGKKWKKSREKTEILRNSIKSFLWSIFYIWLKLNIDDNEQSELTIKWTNLSSESKLLRYHWFSIV